MGTNCTVQHIGVGRLLATGMLALGCMMVTCPASAALYKWTDANGRVVYSDQPPPGDIKTETLQAPPPPANANAVKDMAAKDLELKKRKLEAAENEKKADSQRAELAKKSEQCARTQSQIKQLAAEEIALIRYNSKGEAVYVDDATRRKERADLETWVKANCTAG